MAVALASSQYLGSQHILDIQINLKNSTIYTLSAQVVTRALVYQEYYLLQKLLKSLYLNIMPRTFENVLKTNSKTFYVASKLLPKYIRDDVFKIYSFCRLYDDNVDLDRSDDTNDLEEYILQLGIDGNVIKELKNGINSDINHSGIEDLDELLTYSYKVAGCVGLMMCDVLSIKRFFC